ncbi:MAG: L-fucose/L-arabinose isomerase family protein [Candidatus Sumerlaeota bacterium]|nr:L-fucose/L-arabinose isomerase family protein [Candidatus Sumerlaeota bacterium]
MSVSRKITLGFVPANRGFFSNALAEKMRDQTVQALRREGIGVVVPSKTETKVGCVETREEALLAGRMFREKQVDGILVGAVNFGDEQGVAYVVKEAGLNVPILIYGCQEEEVLTPTTERRDSFCGLLSIGEALRQLGVPYTVAQTPIIFPDSEPFAADLRHFAAVCRVVAGIRSARYGQVGARPNAFWTCRLNEKALQQLGPTVVTLDLSEIIGRVERMKDNDPAVRRILNQMAEYLDLGDTPKDIVTKIAKLEQALRQFIKQEGLDALAVQCWTSIQENLGICSCSTMSRLGDQGTPCACESDIYGAMSMHAIALAGQTPAALADWNNLHNEDPDLANLWHCGVFPKSFAGEKPRLGTHEIIAGSVGREKAQGTCEFRMRRGPLTLARVNDDPAGGLKVFVCQGQVEPEAPGRTFGAYGWTRIPNLTRLYRDILVRHFPHHVAIGMCTVGNALHEAFGNYFGMQVFTPGQAVPGLYTPALPFAFGAAEKEPAPAKAKGK